MIRKRNLPILLTLLGASAAVVVVVVVILSSQESPSPAPPPSPPEPLPKGPVRAKPHHPNILLGYPESTPGMMGKVSYGPWKHEVVKIRGPEDMVVIPVTVGEKGNRIEGQVFNVKGLETKGLSERQLVELPYLFRVSVGPPDEFSKSRPSVNLTLVVQE